MAKRIAPSCVLLGVIFVVALVVRLAMTSAFVGLDAPPDAEANSDQVDFEVIAYHLATGQGFSIDPGVPTARRAPGAPFTFSLAYLISDRSFALLRVWIAGLSAMTCVITAGIAWLMFGRIAGVLAGLGLAFYPGHAYYAMHMLSETPFSFYLSLAVLLSLLAIRFRDRVAIVWSIGAGLAWAMVVMTKPQFLLLAPLVLLWMGWKMVRRREEMRSQLILPAATFAVAALCVTPWAIRNHHDVGVTGLSSIVGHGLWGGNNPLVLDDPVWRGRWLKTSELERRLGVDMPEDEAAANRFARDQGVRFILENPHEMPALTLSKVGRLLTPWPRTGNRMFAWAEAISWMVLAPLNAVGMVLVWRRSRADLPVLLAPLLVTLATTLVFFGIVRYRNAVIPVLMVFGAIALAEVIKAWQRRPLRQLAPLATA